MNDEIVLKNMSDTKQLNMIASWLLNGERLVVDGPRVSGVELAKKMGLSTNEYFTKFLPMKKKAKQNLHLAIDGDTIIETFYDWTSDQLARLKDTQDEIDEDKKFFMEKLKKALDKPLEDLDPRDIIVIKKFSQFVDGTSSKKSDTFKAFEAICSGFGKATKMPDVNATQVNISYRDMVREEYKDGITD